MFFEESENTLILIRPAFWPDKAVIFRWIEHCFEIGRFAEPYQLFDHLHRILNRYVVIRHSVEYKQRSFELVCI